MNEAKDLAGIPRSQQPRSQWQVVGDSKKKVLKSYKYVPNPKSHGRYYGYDTLNGRKVIVKHTNDIDKGLHCHAGDNKAKEAIDKHTYDFKEGRYKKILKPDEDHYIYYRKLNKRKK